MSELALVVIAHRDVDTVVVFDLLLALDEGLVLEVEPVLQQALLEELRNVVQGDMDEYRPDHGGEHVKPPVQVDGINVRTHRMAEQPDGQDHDEKAGNERVEHHLTGIELQLLLVPGSDAGDADEEQGRDLAPDEVPVGVDEPTFHPRVQVHEDASPEVQHGGIDRIEEELQDERHVDEAPEDLVSYDKVLTLFHDVS